MMTNALASPHLDYLRTLYPYGLLTDDFGILNVKDLAFNTCNVRKTEPFSDDSISYPYWQCFPIKLTSYLCHNVGFDESEKREKAILVIGIQNKNLYHEYLSRRAIDTSACLKYKKIWEEAILGNQFVCLSGPFSNHKNDQDRTENYYWVFDKFKTKTKCFSFFEGECNYPSKIGNICEEKN